MPKMDRGQTCLHQLKYFASQWRYKALTPCSPNISKVTGPTDRRRYTVRTAARAVRSYKIF